MTYRPVLLCAFALAACGAAPNPTPSLKPAPWKAGPASDVAPAAEPTPPAAAAAAPDRAEPAPRDPDTKAPADTAARTAGESPGELVVATVAGQPIEVRDLLRQWVHQNSVDVLEQLDRLVLSRFVLLEARRLDVQISPERHDEAFQAAIAAIEKEIASSRPGVTLDQYVDRVLGLDPKVYRETLRDDALRALLAERVMRAWMLQSEHAEVSVIVVKSEEKVAEVQAALAGGESFDAVARAHSADTSAASGGRVPPVVKNDTVMGRLAFQTPVGAVGGPQREQGAWLFVRVDKRPAPLEGDWSVIGTVVEQSLADRGIENLELSQWKAAMLRRYEADITPFLKLVGQPVD